jgi:hypothetical protein
VNYRVVGVVVAVVTATTTSHTRAEPPDGHPIIAAGFVLGGDLLWLDTAVAAEVAVRVVEPIGVHAEIARGARRDGRHRHVEGGGRCRRVNAGVEVAWWRGSSGVFVDLDAGARAGT